MLRSTPLYARILIFSTIAAAVFAAYPGDKGYRDLLLDYISSHELKEETRVDLKDRGAPPGILYEEEENPMAYSRGDWDNHIIRPRYRIIQKDDQIYIQSPLDSDIAIMTYGSLKVDLLYGKSMFTSDRYQIYSQQLPESKVIKQGFVPQQQLQAHVEGKVGDRMTVFIDHDSRKKENKYKLQYRALRDEEVIREINAGQIDIKCNYSKYAVYDNNTAKALGVDMTLKKGNLQVKAFGSVLQGNSEIEIFRGNSSPGNVKLSEYQYVRRKYYQIEPFKRYDGPSYTPDANAYTVSTTMTSKPRGGVDPAKYIPYPVNVSPVSFDLYIDEQNPLNQTGAMKLAMDNGNYIRMMQGRDYSVNFTTGQINFLRDIPEKSRIFAVYSLLDGISTDPCVIHPGDAKHPGGIFAGRNFVFIKYGYITDEDTYIRNLAFDFPTEVDKNNDGKVNLDIYEVRSVYYLGSPQLLADNFILNFFRENGIMTKTEINTLGKYSVDYSKGTVNFNLREPFKPLLSSTASPKIYIEYQPDNIFDYSRLRLRADFYKDARSFQLKNSNLLPGSVKVRVNGRDIQPSLYSVDYTSGFFTFTNPGNPIIGPESQIEIRYEYSPFVTQSQAFVGGLRTDYALNKNLSVGGSLLYSRSASKDTVPRVGEEPTQTVVFEGDTRVHFDEATLSDFLNIFTENKNLKVPLEINAYAEYARSYKNVNTYGKGMIDNLEEADEISVISLMERDWQYASLPAWAAAGTRSTMNYYYYRNMTNPTALQSIFFPAGKIPYAVKPGPYNVAFGHVINQSLKLETQTSLVLDFEADGTYTSICTRQFQGKVVDFSGLSYIEVSYYYEGAADVNLTIDLGKINEDADANGVLGTEDYDGSGVYSIEKDIGYTFYDAVNPTRIGGGPNINHLTRGDGVLNTEDVNRNGVLDTLESTYQFSSIVLRGNTAGWQKARLYVDQSSVNQTQLNILRQVETIRLHLQNSNNKGRVFIDGIRFVSTKWRELALDGVAAGPTNIKLTMLDTINDSAYMAESFLLVKKELYRSMYGDKKNSELIKEKESSLQIEYSVPLSGTSVSATRRFVKPMDLRFYKTLNLWFNYRAFSAGDRIGIILGSSDTDYIEYQFNMDFWHIWREVKLIMKKSSGGEVPPCRAVGLPDLKRISYMKIVIYAQGHSGSLWLDEIYASEPEIVADSAHWYEGEIKVTKPLFRTDVGTPVFSDASIKYVNKGNGAQFSTIGKKDQDIKEASQQVFAATKVLPNWNVNVDYTLENSKTDSLNEEVVAAKRGTTTRNSLAVASDYVSIASGIPSIKLLYKYDSYKNLLIENIAGTLANRELNDYIHSPVVSITEKVDDFLWGSLNVGYIMSMVFKDHNIDRISRMTDIESLASLASLREREKRQKTDASFTLNYKNSHIYLQPAFSLGSEEYVESRGKTEMEKQDVLYDFKGDFHVPFVYNKDFRFIERNKKGGFACGLTSIGYVMPEYKMEIQYFENRFRDYQGTEVPYLEYRRQKDARSMITSQISLPVNLARLQSQKWIKGLTVVYSRNMFLYESSIPYEGERTGFLDERYGVDRSLGGISQAGINLFKYYPFCFFFGRGNGGKARDYVYGKLNKPIAYSDGTIVQEYGNQLKMIDNFTNNLTFDFHRFTLDAGSALNQVCERQNLYGIPSQVVSSEVNFKFNFDMMKFLWFGFFRPNQPGGSHHAANLETGYKFTINMQITSSIEEKVHSPFMGLTFKWDRSSLAFKYGVDLKDRRTHFYLWRDSYSYRDYIYVENLINTTLLKENDTGYNFSTIYTTDVNWLYNFFSMFYKLTAHPIFSLEYQLQINRYSYLTQSSPEPYDLHMVKGKLNLDLHKNVQGGISTRLALEKFRNRLTSHVSREVFSYEIGLNFNLIF